jgi:hypothetical protein
MLRTVWLQKQNPVPVGIKQIDEHITLPTTEFFYKITMLKNC